MENPLIVDTPQRWFGWKWNCCSAERKSSATVSQEEITGIINLIVSEIIKSFLPLSVKQFT